MEKLAPVDGLVISQKADRNRLFHNISVPPRYA